MPPKPYCDRVQARGGLNTDHAEHSFRYLFAVLASQVHGETPICIGAPPATGIVPSQHCCAGDFPDRDSCSPRAVSLYRETSHDIGLKKPTGPSFGECSGLRLREDKRLPRSRLAFNSCFAPYKPFLDVLQRGRVRGRRGGSGWGDNTERHYREAGESDERMPFPDMDLNYLFSRRTNGANPSKIWKFIIECDGDKISWYISRLPYKDFLGTAYWFAVASKRKSDLGMRCQVCNESGKLNVHHRTYDTHGSDDAS